MPEYLVLKGKVVEVEPRETLANGKDRDGNAMQNRIRKIKVEIEGKKKTIRLFNTLKPETGMTYKFKSCTQQEFEGNPYYNCYKGFEVINDGQTQNKEPARTDTEPKPGSSPNSEPKQEYLSEIERQKLIIRQNVLNRAVELCTIAELTHSESPDGLTNINYDIIMEVAEKLENWVYRDIIIEIPF